MQRILVTGATGAVGPMVVQTLFNAGYCIRTLSLDAPDSGVFPAAVEVLIGDVTDSATTLFAVQDIEAVIHMAALLHINNPHPELHKKFEQINVGGTATVVGAAIKAGVKRIVLFSTIAVYGPSNGSVLNEMSPTHPETFYAKTKCTAEQIVLNARSSEGKPLGTVLRLGAVYGSGIKGNYRRLTNAIARHRFIPIGRGLNRRTLVYVKDVGNATILAATHSAAAGRIFNVTDGDFHTLNKIIECICSALGRNSPRFFLPIGPMRIVAGFIENGANTIGIKTPVTRETVDKYTEDIAVDGSLIQKILGFTPQYNLKIGWEETINEMRKSDTTSVQNYSNKR